MDLELKEILVHFALKACCGFKLSSFSSSVLSSNLSARVLNAVELFWMYSCVALSNFDQTVGSVSSSSISQRSSTVQENLNTVRKY